MRSVRTGEFRRLFQQLPKHVQKTAIDRYTHYFRTDPSHPLLKRHTLHDVRDAPTGSISVTIAWGYRAVAFMDGETYVWYWCGTHADYDTRFRAGR